MMEFKEILNPTVEFFDFLPRDWQDELLPQWPVLVKSAKVFCIYKDNDQVNLITMGIVFSGDLPQLTPYEKTIKNLLIGYSYIGYVYTLPEYRGQGCGSKWFTGLIAHYPKHNFWLTIEEPALANFYQKNNFEILSGSAPLDTEGEICLTLIQNQ
jgi:GNAT superfamily N-acetyltransferase